MAISINGKITGTDDSTSWVEEADVERMDALMEKCKVMVMGSRTYKAFGDELPSNKALQVIFTKNSDLLNTHLENVRFTSEDPTQVLENLHKEGFENVLIAGGAELNTSLLNKDLIDEIKLIVKPIIFGEGKALFNGFKDPKKFKLVNSEQLSNNAIELTYEKI